MQAHPFWSWSGLALTLSASALWGLAPVFTKGALSGFGPELTALARLASAALLCGALVGRGQQRLIGDAWLCLAGVALGADFVLFNYGLQRTTAGVAGLLVNVEVLTTIALAVWLLGETIRVRQLVGCLITLGGVVYLGFEPSQLESAFARERIAGNLLVMASSMCWSVFAVGQRRSRAPHGLFARLTTIFVVASLTVLPTCLDADAWRIHADARAWAMLIGLGVFCTFAVYWIYAHAQQLIDVSVLAVLLCTIPIFSVSFAYLLLDEPITPQLVAGGLIVVAGIAVVATGPRQ